VGNIGQGVDRRHRSIQLLAAVIGHDNTRRAGSDRLFGVFERQKAFEGGRRHRLALADIHQVAGRGVVGHVHDTETPGRGEL
jgi:hypothetical protein